MADELLSLKWNNHATTFLNLLESIHLKEHFCDASVACEGKIYQVHKFVLSVCSDYFALMFKNIPLWKQAIVVLKDISSKDFEALLSYMYCGEVNVLSEKLPSMLKAAEALGIKGLAIPDNPAPDNKNVDLKSIDNSHPEMKVAQKDKRNDYCSDELPLSKRHRGKNVYSENRKVQSTPTMLNEYTNKTLPDKITYSAKSNFSNSQNTEEHHEDSILASVKVEPTDACSRSDENDDVCQPHDTNNSFDETHINEIASSSLIKNDTKTEPSYSPGRLESTYNNFQMQEPNSAQNLSPLPSASSNVALEAPLNTAMIRNHQSFNNNRAANQSTPTRCYSEQQDEVQVQWNPSILEESLGIDDSNNLSHDLSQYENFSSYQEYFEDLKGIDRNMKLRFSVSQRSIIADMCHRAGPSRTAEFVSNIIGRHVNRSTVFCIAKRHSMSSDTSIL